MKWMNKFSNIYNNNEKKNLKCKLRGKKSHITLIIFNIYTYSWKCIRMSIYFFSMFNHSFLCSCYGFTLTLLLFAILWHVTVVIRFCIQKTFLFAHFERPRAENVHTHTHTSNGIKNVRCWEAILYNIFQYIVCICNRPQRPPQHQTNGINSIFSHVSLTCLNSFYHSFQFQTNHVHRFWQFV